MENKTKLLQNYIRRVKKTFFPLAEADAIIGETACTKQMANNSKRRKVQGQNTSTDQVISIQSQTARD